MHEIDFAFEILYALGNCEGMRVISWIRINNVKSYYLRVIFTEHNFSYKIDCVNFRWIVNKFILRNCDAIIDTCLVFKMTTFFKKFLLVNAKMKLINGLAVLPTAIWILIQMKPRLSADLWGLDFIEYRVPMLIYSYVSYFCNMQRHV